MTYRQVLAVREFRALFAADVLSVFGDQVARLAVALLVYGRTESALAAAATYACSYLTWLVGGPLLSPAADRYPRRSLMLVCDGGRLLLVLAMCVPGLPLWGFFAALAAVGILTPPFEAARSGMLADIVQGELYVTANALTVALNQAGQVGGFLLGGILVSTTGARGALLIDAATFAASGLLVLTRVRRRPASAEAGETFSADLRAGFRLVATTPELRRLLGYAVIGMVALIAPEGLAVPVAADLGYGAVTAGILTAAVPAGFVIGAWLVLRVPSDRRRRLIPRLVVLACVPLLFTPLTSSPVVVTGLWLVGGGGGALQVIANAAFVSAVPPGLRGRAYGVASTCLMAAQGLTLLAVGGMAEALGPKLPVAIDAMVVLCCLPLLTTRRGRHAQGATDTGRRGRG